MKYEIIINTMEEEKQQEEIYRDLLYYIIKEFLSEVEQNEQSHYLHEGIH
ncbi:MAG: hypothetical protein K0R80_1860 [Clostridia bacterium]|jgi:hypothetical protein|nr:hypothetical protein [Clostridia bacterium]